MYPCRGEFFYFSSLYIRSLKFFKDEFSLSGMDGLYEIGDRFDVLKSIR